MYAIVRCGGRQEKAAVDDVLTVDTLAGEAGSTVTLPALLVVDDGKVVSDPAELGGYEVTAEILGPVAGPKINMIHYRNKTGYRRRLGHRQRYTQLKITGISTGKAAKTTARAKAGSAGRPAAAKSGAKTGAKTGTRTRTSGTAKTAATTAGTARSRSTKAGTARAGNAKAGNAKAETED
ncbi:MAG: 50S ribosomal protein L21 [Actinobacteria bacterium]|nr:50S ribosomal protein L21 [Actinomycetota bacterium]